jgi:homopolymeric O-antigen transport system permease protein
MATDTLDTPLQVIEPPKGWSGFGIREVLRYRELLFALTWRNVLVRYKQTYLGVLWAIVQPVFFMIVFTLFFGRLAGLQNDTNGIPYPIFTYAALLPWTFFATSVTQSSNSLVANSNLLRKIYFPRLALPLSTIFTALVDFCLAFTVLVGLMVYYDIYPPPARLLVLPLLMLFALLTALGVGLWLSALNVQYRDVQLAVPFLIQLWLFATPVVYPANLVSEPLRTLFGLNPMAGVVEGFRWALIDGPAPPGGMLAVSAFVALLLAASGLFAFRRLERTFADVV